jgi:hypothetical protein
MVILSSAIFGHDLFADVKSAWYWLLPIPMALGLGAQALLSLATTSVSRDKIRNPMREAMEAMGRALALPQEWSKGGLRLGCHTADDKGLVLRPVLFVGPGTYDDDYRDIPIGGATNSFVISEAYRRKCLVKRDVIRRTSAEKDLAVRKDLRSVIAAPVIRGGDAIGTVSIDSSVPLHEWAAGRPETDQVVRKLAATAGALLDLELATST